MSNARWTVPSRSIAAPSWSARRCGGGLSLGLRIPFGAAAVAADVAPEVNAWL